MRSASITAFGSRSYRRCPVKKGGVMKSSFRPIVAATAFVAVALLSSTTRAVEPGLQYFGDWRDSEVGQSSSCQIQNHASFTMTEGDSSLSSTTSAVGLGL